MYMQSTDAKKSKMRRNRCALLWPLILYSAGIFYNVNRHPLIMICCNLGLTVYATVHVQAEQCLHETIHYFPMISGMLTVECKVPPDYRHDDATWNVNDPFYLPDCQGSTSSEVITCEANITEGMVAVSMFRYYNVTDQQNCTFQCINNINLLPPSKQYLENYVYIILWSMSIISTLTNN